MKSPINKWTNKLMDKLSLIREDEIYFPLA